MSAPRVAASALPGHSALMEYRRLSAGEALPASALCSVSFGPRAPAARASHPGLSVHVNLPTLVGTGLTELWHARGVVHAGREGALRFAHDERYLAGCMEIDEAEAGGITAAARQAYSAITRFTARGTHHHLLRMYNYFSSINHGNGDTERYKLFCSGRAAGFRDLPAAFWPAASAIGRQDDTGVLQVYWLASTEPGRPIENPRQVSAFHYPREYGPSPPSFSRAIQMRDGLLISGTGSVLGHASHHADDLGAQLAEILRNLASVRQAGGAAASSSGGGTLLKVYLRDARSAGFVAEYLRAQLPAPLQLLVLGGDICRRELLVEIDAVHLGGTG